MFVCWFDFVIQENLSLFNAKKWLQAVVKGDSMLIIYKMNVSFNNNDNDNLFNVGFTLSLIS